MKKLGYFWRTSIWSLASMTLLVFILFGAAYFYLDSQLPDINTLNDEQFQTPMRIYTIDHKLIAEYGEKRRTPVTLAQVPKQIIQAVLATEDQRFYNHPGVDVFGLGRAAIQLIKTGTKSQGGSTITMQVARNFFLSRKKTYLRKFKEILLAIKIEREFSKDKILELYLNKIFLGNRAYGVAAAASVYYGKTLDQLTLPQMAMIAGLPKAPSKLNPLADKEAALDRRNHVLQRMYELGDITKKQYLAAIHTPLTASYHGRQIQVHAPYVAEMIRQALYSHFGNDAYTDGLQVYSTINSKLQKIADHSLHSALLEYDQRHGYRGPITNLGLADVTSLDQWLTNLKDIPVVNRLQPAVIIDVGERSADALLSDGNTIELDWPGLSWAKPELKDGYTGAAPQKARDILKSGDVVRVEQMPNKQWRLAQLPDVEGALIALNPNNGAVEALIGGFNYEKSSFNRVTQAVRQPGSSFKPFIYAAGLAKGYTLASVINDAPIVIEDPSQEGLWRPQNDTRKFYGPTRLRVALAKSVNLVSIRLLEAIGISYAVDYLKNFGFSPADLPKTLSLALGSVSVTPLQMATGYAVFANGGYKVNPYLIDHIVNSEGKMLMQARPACANNCSANQKPAPQVLSPQVAYLMTSAMKDVILEGTGQAAKSLGRPDLAGKTGTTNDQNDAWFSGFNSNIVVTAWVGFDQPHSLYEYGAQAALPMWMDFMKAALADQPEASMPEPTGLVTVKIDPATGLLASAQQQNAIFETFRADDVPKQEAAKTYSHGSTASDTGGNSGNGNAAGEENVEQIF